ncbi:MAG: hypothetical protein ROO76_18185 [Terriglobia bacterium]|nr:hypothetical protein [Terriglobia bacterium]
MAPVVEVVGHLSADMVRHYTHIRTAAKQKAVEAIEKQQAAVLVMLTSSNAAACAKSSGKPQSQR